jgi:hypothetical protein
MEERMQKEREHPNFRCHLCIDGESCVVGSCTYAHTDEEMCAFREVRESRESPAPPKKLVPLSTIRTTLATQTSASAPTRRIRSGVPDCGTKQGELTPAQKLLLLQQKRPSSPSPSPMTSSAKSFHSSTLGDGQKRRSARDAAAVALDTVPAPSLCQSKSMDASTSIGHRYTRSADGASSRGADGAGSKSADGVASRERKGSEGAIRRPSEGAIRRPSLALPTATKVNGE